MIARVISSASATWAVVPVKRLSESKSRLASVLGVRARATLQQAMFADVLAALQQSAELDGVMVVTADAAIAELARGSRAVVAYEPAGCAGLNAAVKEGVVQLREKGVLRALVVPADIPLIETSDIDDIVSLGQRSPHTLVVPSHDLGGTNGLSVHVDSPPEFAFGADSFRRHLNMPGKHTAMRVSLPSFVRDVDTSDDLAAVTAMLRERASRGFVSQTAAWTLTHLSCHEDCPG